jgi:sugar phosphate isomerase/epimerase
VRIAVEVIPNALSTARQLVRLIEDEELPHLGICLDVGHARLQGDVVDALETVAGYLVTTHLHDNRGRSDDHLVPFEGVIDWGELLIGFQKVGYDGTLLFELAAGADGAAATLRRAGAARRRMESLLGLDFAFSED